MKVLIVDNEPRWIRFCQGVLNDTTLDSDDDYDFVILSARFLGEFQTGKPFVVATSQPTTTESIKAYRLGARDYFAKDFRKNKLLEHLS